MHYIAFFLFYAFLVSRGMFGKGNMLFTLAPGLILLGYVIKYAFFRKGKIYVGKLYNPNDFAIYGLFVGTLVLSMIRTGFPNATAVGVANDVLLLLLINFAVYYLLKALFRRYSPSQATKYSILVSIISPGLLILLLITFYILRYDSLPDVEGDFRSEPLFLNLFGMHLKSKEIVFREGMGRVHPNTFGIYSGALFVAAVLAAKHVIVNYRTKLLMWAVIAALALAVIIADSRITFLNTVGTPIALIVLARIKKLNLLPYLAWLIPLFPLLTLLILENVADWDFISMFAKNTNDIATGSARSTIWHYCFEKLAEVKPIHLVGYGEYGHYQSGASLLYAIVFGSMDDASLIVTHNVFFQAFFDAGYIGVIIYIAMLVTLMRCAIFLYQRGESYALALLGFLVYYMFSGIFESAYGMYNRFYTYIVLTIGVLILVLKSEYIKRHMPQQQPEKKSQRLAAVRG